MAVHHGPQQAAGLADLSFRVAGRDGSACCIDLGRGRQRVAWLWRGVTRLRLDAALYDPAPLRLPGTNGRPRTKGKRLATLSAVLADPTTLWQRVAVPGWYGEGERTVEISTSTAVWRHSGLIRDPPDRFAPQALLCTDLTQDPVQVLC